jgi:hypothetical protein
MARGRKLPPLVSRTSRRRAPFFAVLGGATIGPPVSGPVILTISQIEGKAAGGSVVNITGKNFASGMTSSLGAVSAITSTTATITTSAHAAGAVLWNVTTSVGTSASQGFRYLAAPTVTAITPTNGPATIPDATTFVITGTGFPDPSSGVTVTGTVGAGALSGFTLVSATTLHASNLAAPGVGSLAVTVTVDGVASTGGAGLYTGNPPPTVTGVTSVGVDGGSSTCNGTNFVATPTASVNINGTPTSLNVTWISSTEIVELLLVGGPYTAGNWNLTVTNPDGQSATAVGAFEITAESNPQTILGANLKGQWIASQAVVSGANVVSVPDNSGNSNNLSLVSATPPTQVLNDTRFGQSPTTIQMTAANSTYLACPSFAIGGSGSCFIIGAVDYLGSGTQECIAGFFPATMMAVYVSAGNECGAYYVGFAYVTSPLMTAGPATFVGGNVPGTGAETSLNAGAVSTGGSTGSNTTTPAPFVVGAMYNGTTYNAFSSFAWPELLATNTPPTTAQILQLCQYFNDKYGVTQAPSFTSASPVPASTTGAALRVSGANFQPNVSVSLLMGSTVTPVTVVSNSTTIADCTTPSMAAGTYDLIITNTDGRAATFTGVVIVEPATSNAAVAAMNAFGLLAVGVYTGANATLGTGGGVASWLDQSGMSNHLVQSTLAYQPAFYSGASDARFNDKPYIGGNGLTQFLSCAGFALDGASGYVGYCSVVSPGAAGGIRTVTNYNGGATPSLQFAGSGAPEIYATSYTTWGSAISGAQNVDGLTSSTVTSINVANGTPVTTSQNESVLSGYTMYAFANSGVSQFGNHYIPALVILKGTPTSTQLSTWHAFCQSYYGTA